MVNDKLLSVKSTMIDNYTETFDSNKFMKNE